MPSPGYWDGLITYFRALPDYDEAFLIVVDSVEESFPALKNWVAPAAPQTPPSAYPNFEDQILVETETPLIFDNANIADSYFLVCALGLKQLGKHNRHIGILNKDGAFDG